MTSPEVRCESCGENRRARLRPGVVVRPAVADLIHGDVPSWTDASWICADDLARYRHRYVESLLASEKGEIDELQREVLRSLREQDILSRNPEAEFRAELSGGERLSDRIASFGGSWTFIGSFVGVLFLWMALNSFVMVTRAFDPFLTFC